MFKKCYTIYLDVYYIYMGLGMNKSTSDNRHYREQGMNYNAIMAGRSNKQLQMLL